jgi:hypothetical protein
VEQIPRFSFLKIQSAGMTIHTASLPISFEVGSLVENAQVTVAITGAFGAIFGREMLRALKTISGRIFDRNLGPAGDARRRRKVC